MKKHTKIYLDFYGYGEQDFVPCEACGTRAVDVHHINARGMGGDPNADKDAIENLVGLCRICHTKAENSIPFNKWVESKHLKTIELWTRTH